MNVGDLMSSILTETENGVTILKLNRGVTNPINLKLIIELSKLLKNLKEDKSVKSVVLTSNNNKFFSIGFDIPELFDSSFDDVKDFYHNFNQMSLLIYSYPKPIIAVMPGHAIAGGTIIALCCRYRYIAEGKKLMGLNEILLGIPIPYPAIYILNQIVNERIAKEMIDTGDFYPASSLLDMGLVDEVLPIEELLPKAVEKTRTLGNFPQKAYNTNIKNSTEESIKIINQHLAEDKRIFLECWHSDEVRELLLEAKKKF